MKELIEKLLVEEQKTDNLEYGPTGRRFKIYFDADDPAMMRRKLENELGLILYADLLTDDDADIDNKLQEFLKRSMEDVVE